MNHTLTIDFKNLIHITDARIKITNINGRAEFQTTIPAVEIATVHLPDSLVNGIYIVD